MSADRIVRASASDMCRLANATHERFTALTKRVTTLERRVIELEDRTGWKRPLRVPEEMM